MAAEKVLFRDIFPASVDLSAKAGHAVVINSSGQLALCGAGAQAYGILEDTPKAGEGGTVAVLGIVKAVAGDVIAAGAQVEVDAAGKIITFASGKPIGVAREAAAAGQIIAITLK